MSLRKVLTVTGMALGVALALALMTVLVLVGIPSMPNMFMKVILGLVAIAVGLVGFILGDRIHSRLRKAPQSTSP